MYKIRKLINCYPVKKACVIDLTAIKSSACFFIYSICQSLHDSHHSELLLLLGICNCLCLQETALDAEHFTMQKLMVFTVAITIAFNKHADFFVKFDGQRVANSKILLNCFNISYAAFNDHFLQD